MSTPSETRRDRNRPSPALAARDFAVETERALLLPRFEPVGRTVRDTGWTPDPADAYCPRCGADAGPNEVAADPDRPDAPTGCAACRRRLLAWDATARLGRYENHLRAWITELKFHRAPAVAAALAPLLAPRVEETARERLGPRALRDAIVVPVPTPRRRRLARGIDHTDTLARHLAKSLGLPRRRALLASHRVPQYQLPAADRRRNIAGAFRLAKGAPSRISGRTIVLVDDVLTTGATAREAALRLTSRPDLRATRPTDAPPRVLLAVLAVAGGANQGE